MAFRALLVFAFGPALSACQTVAGTGFADTATASSTNEENWAPGFLSDATATCATVPRMPQTFIAKRLFWSFFNTIVFTDRKGVELGFVESWLGDWNNVFGYPGASFYVQGTAPVADRESSIWNIGANQQTTHQALAQQEDAVFGSNANSPPTFDNQNAPTLNEQTTQTQADAGRGIWEMFFRGSSSAHEHHTMAAFMVGSPTGPVGAPFDDDMTVRDCKGQATSKAFDGKLIFRNAQDSQYYQERRNTENRLVIRDFGSPPMDLVRITMKEPCRPFPPFCAQMGVWNWFNHGQEWMGEIVTPGKETNMAGLGALTGGDTLLRVTTSSGESEDMRFLTLYSAYQFSNTRWSPFMNIVWMILILFPIFGCTVRCCCGPAKDNPRVENRDETEVLMQTIESEKAALQETQPNGGFMACCSRRGGRGVGPLN